MFLVQYSETREELTLGLSHLRKPECRIIHAGTPLSARGRLPLEELNNHLYQ